MTSITNDNNTPAVSPLLRKNDMMTDAVSATTNWSEIKCKLEKRLANASYSYSLSNAIDAFTSYLNNL